MNEPIYYVGGSKGGVGKSKMCFALIDYLRDEGKKVLLLESDTSNPDVFKAHHSHADADLVCKENGLDTAEGWIELVNVCSEFPEHHAEKFELYNGSKSKGIIETRGMTLDFPDLADRVADKLYSGRTPINVALKELSIGDRAELRRWKNACRAMFSSALEGE